MTAHPPPSFAISSAMPRCSLHSSSCSSPDFSILCPSVFLSPFYSFSASSLATTDLGSSSGRLALTLIASATAAAAAAVAETASLFLADSTAVCRYTLLVAPLIAMFSFHQQQQQQDNLVSERV